MKTFEYKSGGERRVYSDKVVKCRHCGSPRIVGRNYLATGFICSRCIERNKPFTNG